MDIRSRKLTYIQRPCLSGVHAHESLQIAAKEKLFVETISRLSIVVCQTREGWRA